jgi:CheY-like chemotaxis protein
LISINCRQFQFNGGLSSLCSRGRLARNVRKLGKGELASPQVADGRGQFGGQNNDKGALMAQSRKVLIIEDEEIFAENLQAHFHRCGWDARIACNGKLAVIAASEFRPELILMDYNLPDMNGFEALEAIRVDHCCSCVLMTGHPADTVLDGAQKHGIARILAKPFPLAGLQSLLLAAAGEFCAKCFENGRRPTRDGCSGFAPAR